MYVIILNIGYVSFIKMYDFPRRSFFLFYIIIIELLFYFKLIKLNIFNFKLWITFIIRYTLQMQIFRQ